MKRAKNLKNRVLSWVVAGALCMTAISASLTSCQLVKDTNTPSENVSSAEKDAYDAKILYYQTQVQSLTAQLGEMEQQFYALRDDYMNQLKQLEEQLAAQQKPSQPPTKPEEQPEQQEPPAQDTGDIQLCEYTYRLEGKFAILTSYLGSERDVVVPAAVDGYLVVGLGDSVFADCDVRSVTLPQTLERMGWFTFYQCKNLEKVVLPAGLSNIGYASFDGCSRALCLYVAGGSYAEQYAISFGIPYQTQT